MSDDFGIGPIGIHADGESGSPNVTVIRTCSSFSGVIDEPFAATTFVGSAHVKRFSGAVGEDGAAVAVVEVKFAVWTSGDGVQRVVVVACIESTEEDFAFVDFGIKAEVAINVSVDEKFGGLRDVDFVSDDPNAQWGHEAFFLYEGV